MKTSNLIISKSPLISQVRDRDNAVFNELNPFCWWALVVRGLNGFQWSVSLWTVALDLFSQVNPYPIPNFARVRILGSEIRAQMALFKCLCLNVYNNIYPLPTGVEISKSNFAKCKRIRVCFHNRITHREWNERNIQPKSNSIAIILAATGGRDGKRGDDSRRILSINILKRRRFDDGITPDS